MKTDKQIVKDCNELARKLYKSLGYQVRKGYRFDLATHPQEMWAWSAAAMAYDFIESTDVDNALTGLDE